MTTPTQTISAPGYAPGAFGQFAQPVRSPVPDQTTIIQNQKQGLHTPSNPYPTDPVGGTIELSQQAVRQMSNTFGSTVAFVAEQAGLHILNPTGANLVNPLVITNAIPAEGLVKTAFDSQRPGIDQIVNDPLSIFQTVGSLFTGINNSKDLFDVVYSRSEISGASLKDMSVGFMPIQDSGDNTSDSSLSKDSMLRDNLERAFESNAPHDQRDRSYTTTDGPDLTVDGLATASDNLIPDVKGHGMVFPFYFESLNSFNQPQIEKFITFQATFNGLKESYTPQWDAKTYFGRSSPVYTYQATNRTVGFSFIIWAPNRVALGLVKQRINWLARQCYPSYDKFGNSNLRIIKEAPVIKFTIGDVFRNVPGIITALTYDWMDRWELTNQLIMPQSVKVDIQITIIHDKFMQNDTQQQVNGLISSDFYEFIKPPRRGIGNLTGLSNLTAGIMGKVNSQLTELETNSVVDSTIGAAGNQATSFGGFG
jgi:hypothetical protein